MAKATSKAPVPPLRVTVKTTSREPALPSATETSETVTVIGAPSSLTIVPMPWASATVAPPVALVRLRRIVSSSSAVASSVMAMVTVAWVWLAPKLNVPLVAA